MNQELWNNFVILNSSPASFLQSWQWGEFQEALGNKIYRIETSEDLKALVIVRKLPLGRTYLEVPKGPIFPYPSSPTLGGGMKGGGVWKEFILRLKKIGQKEKAVLARINLPYDPSLLTRGEVGRGVAADFRKPEILLRQTEPEDTILVDLSKSEEELLQNMHEKSRYNIRLAERKGVKVRVATDDKSAFEKFLELLDETSKRDGITSWPHERFWKFREKFMSHDPLSPGDGERLGERSLIPHAELLIGEYQGQILAAAIIMFFGDSATYLYAASSGQQRNANAASLVLWEAIKLAKARGKRWYDMWGVAPAAAGENHPWAGITRFKTRYVKLGITGKEIRNIGTLDLVLDKKFYSLFKLVKRLRS